MRKIVRFTLLVWSFSCCLCGDWADIQNKESGVNNRLQLIASLLIMPINQQRKGIRERRKLQVVCQSKVRTLKSWKCCVLIGIRNERKSSAYGHSLADCGQVPRVLRRPESGDTISLLFSLAKPQNNDNPKVSDLSPGCEHQTYITT